MYQYFVSRDPTLLRFGMAGNIGLINLYVIKYYIQLVYNRLLACKHHKNSTKKTNILVISS